MSKRISSLEQLDGVGARAALGHRGHRPAAATTQAHGISCSSDDAGAAAQADCRRAEQPLAVRMRPRDLDEFVGQEHLLGEGSALRARDRGGPAALDGALRPARQRQDHARADGRRRRRRRLRGGIGGATPGARRCARRSSAPRSCGARRAAPTIFFLDEIHRFNKAQQDALLPAVEEGLLTLIGATTENPYFEVNSALLSRSRVYELAPLRDERRARDARARARRRARAPRLQRRGRRARVPRRARRRRRAHGAGRARGRVRDGRRRRRSRSRTPRTRCSARPCSTTRPATATTTRSRPGSRPRAARTPTPRCSTSRR